jgi:hypothetical protein
MPREYANRTEPTSGNLKKIGTLKYTDPHTGDEIHGEQTASYGHPAYLVKIAATTSNSGDYPAIGSVAIESGSTTANVNFDGAFSFGDPTGLVIMITESGSNQYECRRILSWDNGTHTATIHDSGNGLGSGWPATPSADDTYDLFIDVWRHNSLLVKGEVSTDNAQINIIPVFYDMNVDPEQPTGNAKKPIRYHEWQYTLDGGTITTDVSEATYRHAAVRSFGAHGALLAKVHLVSVSSGTASLWTCAI